MSNELIKDKQSFDPIKLASVILVEDHHTLHKWWIIILKGESVEGWSKEDIFNAHAKAAQAMTERKLGVDASGKHETPLLMVQADIPKKKRKTYVSEENAAAAIKEDKQIGEFHMMCLQEESEEFDFALSNNWISPGLIPDILAQTAHDELRNKDSYLLKKTMGAKSIICLRADDNTIISEKLVTIK